MATMAMAAVERTVVLVHAPGAIVDSDWSSFLARMRRRDYDGLVIWAPGAAPNSRQRRAIIDTWGRQLPQVGVVTESTAVRGVISVLSLFLNDRIRGFRPARLDAALEHVGTPPRLQSQVWDALNHLRASVPERADLAFFTSVRDQHGAALRRAAMTLCRSPADSDDLVQETLELALVHVETLKRASNPRAWLKALLHHRFVSRCRQLGRERSVDLAPFEDRLASPLPEPEPPWATITTEQVWAAAQHLDAGLREVFELYEREGLSYKEIALRSGISINTVASRINRSRSQLRTLLARAD